MLSGSTIPPDADANCTGRGDDEDGVDGHTFTPFLAVPSAQIFALWQAFIHALCSRFYRTIDEAKLHAMMGERSVAFPCLAVRWSLERCAGRLGTRENSHTTAWYISRKVAKNVWTGIFDGRSQTGSPALEVMIDSTAVGAHRVARSPCLGPSSRWYGNRNLCPERHRGRPIACHLTGANVSDFTGAEALLPLVPKNGILHGGNRLLMVISPKPRAVDKFEVSS